MKKQLTTYSIPAKQSRQLEFEMQDMPSFFLHNEARPHTPHMHHFYQIIWFTKGTGTHQVDFVDYHVCDNTLFFVSPGQVHQFDAHRDNEGVLIHFNDIVLSDDANDSVFIKQNMFHSFGTVPYYTISSDQAARLHYLVQALRIEQTQMDAFAHADAMCHLIKLFLIDVYRYATHPNTKQDLASDNYANTCFVQFRQLVEAHFRQLHTVNEYAEIMHISTRSLSEYVRQSSPLTPLQIINDRIILEAKRQLIYSSLKVKEISYSLGFNDPSYFVKFFKHYVGCIPTDFRAKR